MKVYSNKVLLFVESGQEFVVKIGFTTAPDWIGKTDLFEAAKKEGSLKVVEGSTFAEGEKKLAAEEKAAYEAKIAELEAKLAAKETVETPVETFVGFSQVVDEVLAEIEPEASIEIPVEVEVEEVKEAPKPTKSKK
jgi:hypothetical protein